MFRKILGPVIITFRNMKIRSNDEIIIQLLNQQLIYKCAQHMKTPICGICSQSRRWNINRILGRSMMRERNKIFENASLQNIDNWKILLLIKFILSNIVILSKYKIFTQFLNQQHKNIRLQKYTHIYKLDASSRGQSLYFSL